MRFDTVAIVGVGLIGGSIGMAVKARHVARHVIGVGRNSTLLVRAKELHAIDDWFVDLAEGVKHADIVIVCSPVNHIARQILDARTHFKPNALITDAGSTKASIVRAIEQQAPALGFIGSHPLAGSEKQGVEHARADLFVQRTCVLTPTPNTRREVHERIGAFWQALGMRVQDLLPEEHDLALATTSHLPHMIAAVLAGQLPDQWRDFAATGFRDTTRIAAGDPTLWAAIAHENATALNATLLSFSKHVEELRQAIVQQDSDELIRLLTTAKKVRDDLGS